MCVCIYKMNLISAEGYKNAKFNFLTITKTNEIWVNMKNVGDGFSVIWLSFKRNIWYLWEKKITKEEIKCFKMTEIEIYKKVTNLKKMN